MAPPRAQVRPGLRSADVPDNLPTSTSAAAALETLEGRALTVRMDEQGVRIESAADAQAFNATTYDCVNSLLLNNSVGFTAHFNSSLARALAIAVEEQRAQPPAWEDAEEQDVTAGS